MKKMENKNATDKYVESKSIRDTTLDKIKVIPYLTKDMVLTIDQVANYYEVTADGIRTVIKRNRGEFESDGMAVLRGKELEKFKQEIGLVQSEPTVSFSSVLTLLPKRSLLRAGMILTNSGIATQVRDYLLNIEERTKIDTKSWAIQREVGKNDLCHIKVCTG